MKRGSNFGTHVRERARRGRLQAFPALLLLMLAFVLQGTPLLAEHSQEPCGPACVREHLRTGGFHGAMEAARELQTKAERIHGPNSREVANASDLLSEALRQAGRAGTPEAFEVSRRAVAIREGAEGTDPLELAASLHELGSCYFLRGEYDPATPLLERAFAIRTERLGRDHPDLAASLFMIGALRSESGDHSAAKSLLERSVVIRESAWGRDSPEVAEALNALASVQVRMGYYADAESLYSRALEIWETKWGRDHPKVATCLNNISTLLYATGDYEGALAAKRKALAIRTRTLGPEHELVAWTLANIGMNLAAMGRVEAAREHYQRAIRIQSRRFGEESDEVGWTMKRLGDTYLRPGSYGTARKVLDRATKNLELGLGPEHPDVAEALASLGASCAGAGDTAAGNGLHKRALQLLERRLGPDHPEVGFTLTQYAHALSVAGAGDSALALSLRGEEISREHLRLTCRSLPERAALAYAAARPAGGRLAVSLLGTTPASTVEIVMRVWDSLVRSRTLVMDEIAARNRAAFQAADPEARRRGETLAGARRRVANLQVAGPGTRSPDRYRAELDQAREDMERAERSLAAVSATFSQDRKRASVGYREVAAALPKEAALVAYALAQDGSHVTYVAFVLTSRDANPSFMSLGDGPTIDKAVSRWIADLAHHAGRNEAPRGDKGRVSGNALRKLVWDPVSQRLDGVSRVFLVPDGPLHLVPFAALPWRRTDYLIESGREFHYLSAERDLVETTRAPRDGSGMLAMGDPQFDLGGDVSARSGATQSTNTCLDFSSVDFTPLPSSGPEAREVAQVWSAREHAEVLLGREATEAAFKANAPGRHVLHLATHGFFLDGTCVAGATDSRGIGATTKRAPHSRVLVHNPIHLSGLAWAGANQRASGRVGTEDGILTSEEIAVMDLTGVEWAVLSACDTGRGRVQVGEGVLGLRRAFQVAGVRTIVMSLWAVDDESARQWMKALYEARVSGKLDTAASVTQASLSVLRERRARSRSTEPFHWASFVAAGDWR